MVGAGGSEILRIDQQAEVLARVDIAAEAQRPSGGKIPSSSGDLRVFT